MSKASISARCARLLRVALVAGPLLLLVPGVAGALPSSGVDFTSPLTIDATSGHDLTLSTTEDVYLFVPNGLFVDTVTLDAALSVIIDAGVSIDFNAPLLCSGGCPSDAFDLAGDVVLNVLDPVGNLLVQTGGSIVVSVLPVPEPVSGLLVAGGLVLLGATRVRRPRS
jgi:hypothetical protein